MTRILLIDDDPQFRNMVQDMLDTDYYCTVAAANGKEGCDLFDQGSFDLVITDILMPSQDGIDTILQLKRKCPSIKIIAMSGGRRSISSEFNLTSAHLLGVNATLAKPFTRQQLLKVVKDLL